MEILQQGPTSSGEWEVVCRVTPVDYLSSYTLTGMTYQMGSAAVSGVLNYKTENIEFWKQVSSPEDWKNINNNMTWNYHVTRNIDFGGVLNPYSIRIDGQTGKWGSTGFTGKIDGRKSDGEPAVLSNITLSNVPYASVFHSIPSTGVLRNLCFDHLTLVATSANPELYTGLVRWVGAGYVRNVHVRNKSIIQGVGRVGGIVAYKHDYGAGIEGCSVADSKIIDGGGGTTLYLGGIVGNGETRFTIRSCYVRNVDIQATASSVIQCVGGIIGRSNHTSVTDCYATGTIVSRAVNTGGIVGEQVNGEGPLWNCWSNMRIDSTYGSGRVGGVLGYGVTYNANVLSMGDIFSASDDLCHRITGFSSENAYVHGQNCYAYDRQRVNNLEKTDVAQVRGLLSAAELADWPTWSETVKLGRSWNYTHVERGYFPKVCFTDGSGEVWGQTDIPLPSVNVYEISVGEARYTQSDDQMYVQLHISHPEQDLRGWTDEQLRKKFVLSCDGIDLTKANFVWQPDNESTTLIITNIRKLSLLMALDVYPMTIKADGSTELRVQVDYHQPFYWEVPNIDVWNDFMSPEGYNKGQTGENFLITGMIDFAQGGGDTNGRATTPYIGLRLGRLEGQEGYGWKAEDGKQSVENARGFKNLRYTADASGKSWIESVAQGVERLHFDNMLFQFNAAGTETRARTAPILSCADMRDLVLTKIYIEAVQKNAFSIGFVGRCEGILERVRADTMEVRRTDNGTNRSYSDYAGTVVGSLGGGFGKLEAKHLRVDLQDGRYVGGVVGYTSNLNINTKDRVLSGTFEDIYVRGGHHVGGVVGYAGAQNVSGVTVRRAEVHCTLRFGGAVAGQLTVYSNSAPHEDILVSGCQVYGERDVYAKGIGYDHHISNSHCTYNDMGVGGVAGYLTAARRVRVENTTVQGCDVVGGVAAYLSANVNLRDVEVVDCTITSKANDNSTYTALPMRMAAGGICGYQNCDNRNNNNNWSIVGAVVRNTKIEGRSMVGGVVGSASTATNLSRCFVAEDVTVTATGYTVEKKTVNGADAYVYTTNTHVGGLVGQTQGIWINNSACGAAVTGPGSGVGGLIGTMLYSQPTYYRRLQNVIYAGERVRGSGSYVGGVIGRFDSPNAQLAQEDFTGIIVTTNVSGGGSKNSLWINDTATASESMQNLPGIHIWENCTLNGQVAKDIVAAADKITSASSVTAKPAGAKLIQAAQLYTKEFYSGIGFAIEDTWGVKNVLRDNKWVPYDYITARAGWFAENLDGDKELGQQVNKFFPYPAITPWSVNDCREAASAGGAPEKLHPVEGVRQATDQTPSQVLELARWKDADVLDKSWSPDAAKVDGLHLPAKDSEITLPAATVVYASGIDTLNIETETPNAPVRLCGLTLITDENGVASVTYDFMGDPQVNGYTAEGLRRDTLVNGIYWYFIDKSGGPNNGKLHVGKYNITQSETLRETSFVKVGDAELTNVIHLWGDQALTKDGKIYKLIRMTATESGSVPTDAPKEKSAQPFLFYKYGSQNADVKVFHNFTLYGTEKLKYMRLYQLNNRLYPMSAYKSYVYDGVLLASSGSGDMEKNYFAVLSKEQGTGKGGSLTSYLAPISSKNWNSTGIKQMSNTFNTTEPIVVLRYGNGRVCVVDVKEDFLVYDSQPARMSLLGYAGKYISSILRPDAGAMVPQDPTYKDALDEAKKYRDPEEEFFPNPDGTDLNGSEEPGEAELPGEGKGNGEGVNGGASGVEDGMPDAEKTDSSGQLVSGSGQGDGDQSGGPDGESGMSDMGDAAGEGSLSGEPGEGSVSEPGGLPGEEDPSNETDQSTGDGTNQINGAGGPEGPGGSEPGSAVSEEGGLPGEEGGELTESGSGEPAGGKSGALTPAGGSGGGTPDEAEDLPETLFVQPEEGKVFKASASGGVTAVSVGTVSRDETSGTYSVAGRTYYPDQSAQPPKGLPEAVTLISEELHTKQLMSELGSAMVAYDPVTGQYSPYVTETLLGGDAPRKTTDPVPGKTLGGLDEEGAAPEEAGKSDFAVGHGLGRDLTPREQSGFALLALAAIAAFGILGVLFAREKRRKR